MLDTTVDKSEAPTDYVSELSHAHGGVIVLIVLLGLIGAIGLWLTDGPGFWPGVGWTLMGVVALVELVLLTRDQLRRMPLAGRARLWVAPSSGKLILLEVIE